MMTVITGKVSVMTKMTLEVDHDQLTDWMVEELKQCYIDHATHWKKEPDYSMQDQRVAIESALKVIRTWASVPGALVPADVVKLCDRNLK